MIDITGLDKAEVLLALYGGSQAQGRSFVGRQSIVTIDEARAAVANNTYFDYWKGHVLKVNLAGDSFDPRLYDRDCGQGVAARAIDRLRGV